MNKQLNIVTQNFHFKEFLKFNCKEPNQSILKEISPEYSLEGLILKLKLQPFGHLMQRTDLLEKFYGEYGQQRMRPLDSITDSLDMNLSKFWEQVKDREARCAADHEITKS